MALNPDALYSALVQDLQDSGVPFRDSISSCTSASELASFSLRQSLFKKFEEFDEAGRQDADSKAIHKFLATNSRCGTWRREHRSTLFLDCLVGYFKDEIYHFFNHEKGRRPLFSTFEEILQFSRCGPGAAIGARGGDFYTKLFSSNLCCTGRILEYAYLNYFSLSNLWADAEKSRQSSGFGYEVVPGNRITTVPKNVDISRCIAIEPSLNMFAQLGLAEILTRRLKQVYSIDLSSQPEVNRELARRGSLDDSLVTIDLESASDSMPWQMIKEYFPRDVVSWLGLLRSPECTLPNGEQVPLHMVSTMGNGFTFPLQTLVFSAVVSACHRYMGNHGSVKAGEDWSVFGDDIICRSEFAGPVIDLLEHLGFLVNTQKSYFEGPFRESCGSDFFRGQNVRGVYIKRLKTAYSRYAVINQLNHWSAKTGIRLSNTVKMLLKTVKDNPIPVWDNDDAGIKTPHSMLPAMKIHKTYQSIVYRRYASRPLAMRMGEGVIVTPRGQKRRIYNPAGLFIAFLHGSVRSGEIHVRHDMNHYRGRLAVAPNWELSPTVSVFATDVERQRWETAVRSNLL